MLSDNLYRQLFQINISKREAENRDSLPKIEMQTPKKLNLDKAVDSTTENSSQSIEDFLILEAKQYLLLHKIADNLEISDLINENSDGDQTDGFRDKGRELVENIYEEIRNSLDQDNKGKGQFVKAIMRIFSILLNTEKSSIKKIKKIIKTSASLVLELWPEQGSPLDG